MAEQRAFLGRAFVNVNMLFDLDQIVGSDLRAKPFPHLGNEAPVEIVSDIVLFEIGIHPRKW
jgi:hypothetical protein